MKLFTRKEKEIDEDEVEIKRVRKAMSQIEASTTEYTTMNTNLDVLKKGRGYVKNPNFISKDVLVVAGVNVAIAFVVMGFEHGHVITTKLASFLIKGRV